MALEPAGVSLEAQGFNQYIKKLEKIDKEQREVFDTKFKGTALSFQEVTRLAKDYERQLEQTARAERKAAQEAEKAARKRIDAAKKARKEEERQQQERRGAVGQVVGGTLGGAIAAGPAGAGLVLASEGLRAFNDFRRESIELSRIQASAEAQLDAAIRSTGGAAGLTADELKAQAAAFQELTNFGDEATIAAQAQLLTFTQIGSEVFPRATAAILDLSTRMDGDLKGAVLQVGKALNDPIAGLSALSESGIQFTDVQKKQVEELVKANDIFSAQSIILAELEKQFGGSAEAARKADGGAIALSNSFGDLQEELGEVFRLFSATFKTAETGIKIIGFLQDRIKTLQQIVVFAGAGFAAFGSIISQTLERLKTTFANIGRIIRGEATEPIKSFSQILDEAGEKAIQRFKELAPIIGETFDEDSLQNLSDGLDEATESVNAYENALKQAENLQLSFARAAEDSARRIERANEDIARRQGRQTGRLGERQAKDRDRLLSSQIKELDKFDADRRKQIAKAESDIRKERQKAADQRKRDQQKLQRELAAARERFNLSQLQSERRFALSERRLIAEGDILAIQQLREDRELERLEEKENFNQSQKDRVRSASEQQKDQANDLEDRVKELQSSLEDQRAELLKSFDEQLAAQVQSQAEARAEQQRGFQEQAEDRAIALAREEEDRRISQARQLEDLGRSLADQEGVTEEGANNIANELEKVFGQEGVADNIFSGFKQRTESDFKDLFENLEDVVSGAKIEPVEPIPTSSFGTSGDAGVLDVASFDDGGVVPGPIGSPQIVQAHGGETVLPTHKQSISMVAPVIPSQNLDVRMSGGFDITGGDQANEAILQATAAEITENFRIAVRRLARKN